VDEQIADVTRRIEADPNDATLFLRRGELHRIHRDWARAEADYARARRLDPALAAVDLGLGKMLLDAGRPAEAAKALDAYVERRADDPEGYAARARAHARAGDPLAAARDFTRAIDLHTGPSPPRPEHYLGRARALAEAGPSHLDEAIRGLDEGLARLGPAVTLELAAIDLEIERGAWEAALARVERAAVRSGRKETWEARRGAILEASGRTAQARAAYARALAAMADLPPHRRGTPAMADLERDIRAALERLGGGAP
jgi:predicted Zn-dependent protease